MNNLSNYITEKLRINQNTRSDDFIYIVFLDSGTPRDEDDLKYEKFKEIKDLKKYLENNLEDDSEFKSYRKIRFVVKFPYGHQNELLKREVERRQYNNKTPSIRKTSDENARFDEWIKSNGGEKYDYSKMMDIKNGRF